MTPAAMRGAPPAAGGAVAPRRSTLLIVDDEEGPRQSLQIIFRDDYEVLLADGGRTATELAQFHGIDVAILDIRMPGMSGIEVLNRLKEINPAMEVIMLTAYETLETARQALRLGACDYLAKPFDLEVIRAAVSRAMERRNLSAEIAANGQRLRELREEIQRQRLNEEVSRTKGEIYASILHDINGPLTVICGFIDIMNESISRAIRLDERDLIQLRNHLGQANLQVTKCVEISRRYLSYLRKSPTEKTSADVGQIMNDLVDLLKMHPSAKGHHLEFHPLRENVRAKINGTDLIQILLNLSVNAFQCTPARHQVEISAECLERPLTAEQLLDGPGHRFINREQFANRAPLVAISIRDDGPGIPAEVLPQIFDSYFTTKSDGQGTGLGLAIVQRFVQGVAGAVELHSLPGQGTRFTVYIPAGA